VSSLELPEECLILSVQRGRKHHLAHGYTVLRGGDRLTVFAHRDCAAQAQALLVGEAGEDEPGQLQA
jgi:Trk K+ transport system NAD-binding subunit